MSYTTSMADIQKQVVLAPYTSFGLGGPAEHFVEVHSSDELITVLKRTTAQPIWLLGYGSNTLISDKGLPGLTVVLHGGAMEFTENRVVADAGVWWDSIVQAAIDRNLWGVEFLSYIPGSLGAALYINITAYGQSIGPRVEWVDIWNPSTLQVERMDTAVLLWDYKQSVFQQPTYQQAVILRACLILSNRQTDELLYQKAVDVASELHLDMHSLQDRRKIIYEARLQAGSIWDPSSHEHRTVGSFFRNPLVDPATAERIIAYDESGKTALEIKKMNQVHGGSAQRVSAAHVMLAAGFKRGQRWGQVKLNDQNLLKIEALEGATAQDVYTLMRHIQDTCLASIGVKLEPEARILGSFTVEAENPQQTS